MKTEFTHMAHHFGGGVYAKETHIPAGHTAMQHKHTYDHLSILASGTAVVYGPSVRMEIRGPQVITIPANNHHQVEAITDCVWFCIHATEETNPDKIDELLIAKVT